VPILLLSWLVICGLELAAETDPRYYGTRHGVLPEIKSRVTAGANH